MENLKTYVIQAKEIDSEGNMIPAQGFGYTALETAGYMNWFNKEWTHRAVLHSDKDNFKGWHDYRTEYHVPVGSAEFVLAWFRAMGVTGLKPLNIPKELWKFVKREIKIAAPEKMGKGGWFCKSPNCFDSDINDFYLQEDILGRDIPNKKLFMTKWVNGIRSEWRVFVYMGNIVCIRCYSGDEWILPDRDYIQSIVDTYGKNSYAMDVMVSNSPGKDTYQTDLLEVNDFFSCNLYGFEDHAYLSIMWETAIRDILQKYAPKNPIMHTVFGRHLGRRNK